MFMPRQTIKPSEHGFGKFSKYHITIYFGDLNASMGREGIFKPVIGNDLYKIMNDNRARKANFATYKNQKWDVPTSQYSYDYLERSR
jgi:hypothetical protein